MKATPLKGTRDYLPKEAQLRDYLQNIILETYRDAGFMRITTPIIEDAQNLDKSDGGENLNLIFKILKRGDKLTKALSSDPDEKSLCDMGLRYDLTLPLSRYYANNRNELMAPFKVIQMDRVYRAERPQKGRLREFMQCDIDIIGNASTDAEVELILTTTKALKRIGIDQFTVKINDRRILKSIFSYAGFAEEDNEKLAIIFDKLDKIGLEGVEKEMQDTAFDPEAISRFLSLFESGNLTIDTIASVCDASYVNDVKHIIDTVKAASDNAFDIVFTPSLVRGQGYYTGTIFEVEAEGYSGACAGGGRYDNLIGKFLNENIPAVGFSIGFERIIMLLLERDFEIPGSKNKTAYLIDKKMPSDKLLKILEQAKQARAEGQIVNIAIMKKNKKFQKDQMLTEGYTQFEEFYADSFEG